MKYPFRLEHTACLVLLMTLVSCSTAQPTVPNTNGLQARLKDLQDSGAAEVLAAEQHHAVDRAISAVLDRTSLAQATKALDEFEAAFDDAVAREANTAREACIRLDREMAQVEKTVAGGAGCVGLPDAIADLKDQLSEIRSLAFTVEDDVRAALQEQRLVSNARSAVNDVIVAAAVCGTVRVNSGNADQMLEAAGRMARTKLAYGSAVRLYARIIEGSPGTEAAEAARRRIGIFGPDVQQKLADTVRSAAAACDTELAHQNLKELDGMMAALSELAVDLVEQSISRGMPELNQLIRAMDAECGPDRIAVRPDSVSVAIPVTNEGIEIEDLIVNEHFDTAGARIGVHTDADEKRRLEERAASQDQTG